MTLREPPFATQTPNPDPGNGPEVSIRVLVLLAVAVALAVFGWRAPAAVNPILVAVATFAVLDRVTDRRRP